MSCLIISWCHEKSLPSSICGNKDVYNFSLLFYCSHYFFSPISSISEKKKDILRINTSVWIIKILILSMFSSIKYRKEMYLKKKKKANFFLNHKEGVLYILLINKLKQLPFDHQSEATSYLVDTKWVTKNSRYYY